MSCKVKSRISARALCLGLERQGCYRKQELTTIAADRFTASFTTTRLCFTPGIADKTLYFRTFAKATLHTNKSRTKEYSKGFFHHQKISIHLTEIKYHHNVHLRCLRAMFVPPRQVLYDFSAGLRNRLLDYVNDGSYFLFLHQRKADPRGRRDGTTKGGIWMDQSPNRGHGNPRVRKAVRMVHCGGAFPIL